MNRAIACGIVLLGLAGLTHAQVEPEALVLDNDPALWQKLSTTATVGYDSRYVLIRLGLPATVGKKWGLRPFVARSIPLAAIDDYEDDVTYWGLHVEYSF